jgi:PAS domain S-box-containing protein
MVQPDNCLQAISILYVEDEAEAREMVSSMLTRKYPLLHLFTGEHGADGLRQFHDHRPEIVMTDISMPVMDGIKMSARIKELAPDTIIIAVTAFSDTPFLMDAIEIGFNHYVLKPIDYVALFAVLNKSIEAVTLKRQISFQNQRIRKLSRAVEESPCSILITDTGGAITYANPKFTQLTGYTMEEVIGSTPRIMKSGRMPASTYKELWSTIIAGSEWHGEFMNRKKNGELYWESASISPIFNDFGEITHYVAVKEDITHRKQAEEQIELLNTELSARAAEMSKKATELELANQELEAFNYTVSHDLRSPLANISLFSQVIMELYCTSLDEECRKFIKGIQDETIRMSQLIDTLLGFARLTRSELSLKPLDLSRIAGEVAHKLTQFEPERRAEFRIAEGIMVKGDESLLRVVLANMLGNAWKYSAQREEAVIEFGRSKIGGNQTCYVRDNGAGFDMAYEDQLFAPFKRLPGTETIKGFGIGLATVKRIIKLHGGQVWGKGEQDKGATFYFTLPDNGLREST